MQPDKMPIMQPAVGQRWWRTVYHAARRLFSVLERIGRSITRTINFVLVVLVFFLAVGPLWLVMRLAGRRLLELTWPPPLPSSWLPHVSTPLELDRFRRQF